MNCQNDNYGTTTQTYVIGNCTIQQGNQELMAYSTMVTVMYVGDTYDGYRYKIAIK